MTIATTSSQIQYAGDGVSTVFPFPTPFIAVTDIKPYLNGVLQATGFSVAGSATIGGSGTFPSGTVTFSVAPGVGVAVLLVCDPDQLQSTSLPPNDPFPSKTVEKMIDKLTLLIQRIYGRFGNAITFPVGETTNGVLPPAAVRANNLASFDAAGNVTAVAPAAGTATALALLLASTAVGQGGSQIGINDAANYFAGANAEAIFAELGNPKGKFQLDGVNVLLYIPPAEWPAIIAGTSVTDLKTYLQAAITAEPNLIFPDGLFNTSQKLVMRTDSKIRGINRRGARFKGTAANTIFEFPIANFDPEVSCIRFQGTGCTGISVAITAGTLQGYLASPHIHDCDFDYDLAFGMNADCIFARIIRNTFGVYGVAAVPAPGTSTFVAMKSVVFPATSNFTNLNVVRDCIFQNGGSTTVATVQLTSGTGWHFENCDWEKGGVAIDARDVHLLELSHCWFEANASAAGALVRVDLGTAFSRTSVHHCFFTNNTVDRIFQYTSGFVQFLDIHENNFGLIASGYPIFDNNTSSRLLPGNASIAWWKNNVVGGNAANKVVTGLNFKGGTDQPRFWATVNTAGSGTLLASSDPGATIVRNSAGNVTITWSNPFCSAAGTGNVIAGAQNGPCRSLGALSTTQIAVGCYTFAGVPQDDVFHVTCFGV